MTKHNMRMFGVSPFSSYKATVKQKLIIEKWDVGYLPAFVILMSSAWNNQAIKNSKQSTEMCLGGANCTQINAEEYN